MRMNLRDGRIELANQIFCLSMRFARDAADGEPVLLLRIEPDSGIERFGRNMMGVGDERNAHPAANGFVFPAHVMGMPAGPIAEHERERQCEKKPGDQQDR